MQSRIRPGVRRLHTDCRYLTPSLGPARVRPSSEVRMKTHRYATLAVLLVLPLAASSAQSTASEPALKAVAAAKTFLGMLDARQRAKVNIDLNTTTRSRWSNLPNGATGLGFERNGIKLGDMTVALQD